MIDRRDVLIGAGCLAAAGAAFALKPRDAMSLANGKKIADIIPTQFGGWRERKTNAIVTPESENSLVAKLYSETVGRLYETPTGDFVMMLIAYGDTQNDLLQLHRPEVCYPAFGFNVLNSRATPIPLMADAAIPGRAMLATSRDRNEQIAYWTRIGEYLPISNGDQRVAKLRTEFQGSIPDGVLVRLSNLIPDDRAALELNRRFARDMIASVAPVDRPVLIGTALARQTA